MAINPKNPRNPQSELFKSLTRLFSGPIINYRSQTGRKIRRQHLDKYSSQFRSASGQQFKRSTYNPLDIVAVNAIANQRRSERYIDFDQMEYMPEIASSMDIYADEMTTHSSLQPMLMINCTNEEIKAVLDVLYHNIMNVNYNLFGWCRTMSKYGDFFLYLDIDEIYGIKSTIALPSQEVERLEGLDATNPNYVQYQWNNAGMTFENWQISHFRILGNDKYAPYGTSILEPARRIWRQLTLMEDAMMAYRVIRSPERRVFKIDVGTIPPQDIEQYMQKIVTQMKRHQVIDPDTGRVDLRYNPLSIEEDYFIPVRAGSSSDITTLPGGSNTTEIDDIKYLRDKLFSALKVPQSYLSRGEGADEDKTTLAQKDIRFARTIQRLQRVVVSELEKVGIIHLYTLGFRGDDLLSFKLALNNPSKIAELQELEHWRSKFDTAAAANEGYFSRRWVAEKLFNMSEEEFLRNQRELFYDRKQDAALQAIAEAGALGGEAGGLGGDLGAEFGGLEGADDAVGDIAAAGAEPEEPSEDDSMLITAPDAGAPPPGHRDSPTIYKSPPGHGTSKYHKKKVDQRGLGALRRGMARAGSPEVNTYRTNNPGAPELRRHARGSIYEQEGPIYNDGETRLFEINHEVRSLIKALEEKKNKVELKKDETKAQ
jgi:hypothetical protein|tara:strand:+ start:2023 stop:3987 length:1965 start_codon:yes stop_codon:yes gene_type:complete